ncbi:MAG: hypothetical protein KDA78_20230, partial [Planctomycetaceae bacterium]|nr:hypothetical protein [Planctomycetaceae bacterium]
ASSCYLIRYGHAGTTALASCESSRLLNRGAEVVVQTGHGTQLADVMESVSRTGMPEDVNPETVILREATAADLDRQEEFDRRAEDSFLDWQTRIAEWKVDVELMDLEWTLDGERLLIYVLNERGPECTKLALMAAAKGQGIVEVVPLSATGISKPQSGGCGSGGCRH